MADDHAGLGRIGEVLADAAYQRCYVRYQERPRPPAEENTPMLPAGLRWLYTRRDLTEAKADLAQWLAKWQAKYRNSSLAEDTIEETFTYFRLPMPHHKHMKSTNMLERLNEGIRRRTYVMRIFPNADSCRRLVRALAVETHENWMRGKPIPQHGRPQGAQEARSQTSRMITQPSTALCRH